ncbi:MAG: hypothetical protein GY714_01500 [Desulfobacterales bacterium]|nr:hypothetical protein [Desulfobacterales bacterium]
MKKITVLLLTFLSINVYAKDIHIKGQIASPILFTHLAGKCEILKEITNFHNASGAGFRMERGNEFFHQFTLWQAKKMGYSPLNYIELCNLTTNWYDSQTIETIKNRVNES